MQMILKNAIEGFDSLWQFYTVQKEYIDIITEEGMKKNRIGFLLNYYFAAITNGPEEIRNHPTFQNLEKALKKHVTILQASKRGVMYTLKSPAGESIENVAKASVEYSRYEAMPRMHGSNTLVMLITKFEEFVSDFIRFLYEKFPEKYLNNKTVTFLEVSEMCVNDVKQRIIDREVDSIMRKSFSEWFKLFEDHKIKFDICKDEYAILSEIYARRNIVVHNSGIVNESYLNLAEKPTAKLGEYLIVDNEYLKNAFSVLKTIVFCIMIEGAKFEATKREKYIERIFLSAFEELCNENYSTCITVFSALANCKYADEITKAMSKVDLWIAKIELFGLDSVKSEIERMDVSAMKKSFVMAKLILLNKYDEATGVIEELYNNGDLPYSALNSWPLFIHYRKTEEYKSFLKKHPELEGVNAVEPQDENYIEDCMTKQNIHEELENE